jgi:periplasmic protein TonB
MTISISTPASTCGHGGDGGFAASAIAEASSGSHSSDSHLSDRDWSDALSIAPSEGARWVICFVFAAALHGIAAYCLLAGIFETAADSGVDTPVVMLDLPEALAPSIASVQDLPPGPVEPEVVETTTTPKEQETTRPDLVTEAPLPIPEPPKPEPERAEVVLPRPDPPPKAEPPPPVPAPSAPQAARTPPPSVVRWQSQLAAHIERFKRYPQAARAHGAAGTATVAFTINHEGRLLHSSIVQSSGSAVLDHETLAMLERAQPMPSPPGPLIDGEMTFVIPVRFSIR